MKKCILMILALLVLVFSSFLFVSAQQEVTEEDERFEEKIYSEATIDDDFVGDSVLVVMDKKVGGINKVHEESFFGDFPKEYIKDLTELTVDIKDALIDVKNWRQVLQIKLLENSKENVLNVIRRLERIEGIVYAGPDYFLYPDATYPDDPGYGNQWALTKINAPAAWDFTTGSTYIKVGIIDTGIAYHEDLDANVIAGWSFDGSSERTDDDGHGTVVAGIVGAVGNNNTGITGVNWNVKLVPLKFATGATPYNSANGGTSSQAANAINYAKNSGIPIVNLSWTVANDPALLSVINGYFGLLVCSVGNDGQNIDLVKRYPASWRTPYNNILTVGAADRRDTPASYSAYSSTTVDIFAPGGECVPSSTLGVLTTDNLGGYSPKCGTSIAAPHVAGVVALMMSHSGYMDAFSIKNIISRKVTPVTALNSSCVAKGLLNAYEAVKFTVQSFIPCRYGCMTSEQTCAANCSNACNQEAINMGCNPSIPWCWEWFNNCVSECEQNCTNTYGTSCYQGCSY